MSIDNRKRDMLIRSFDEWSGHKDPMDEFYGQLDIWHDKGAERRPMLHIEVPDNDIPIYWQELYKIFFKGLVQTNNVYNGDNFRYFDEKCSRIIGK